MAAVDQAISLIQHASVSYEVGPFGTSVEGDVDAVNDLIRKLQKSTIAKEFLLNVQYHVGGEKLSNAEKVAKFR